MLARAHLRINKAKVHSLEKGTKACVGIHDNGGSSKLKISQNSYEQTVCIHCMKHKMDEEETEEHTEGNSIVDNNC